MKIKEYLSQHRNDFTAIMECEHCGHEHKLTTGYDDDNYHNNVIPAMKCGSCGKSSKDEMVIVSRDGERDAAQVECV